MSLRFLRCFKAIPLDRSIDPSIESTIGAINSTQYTFFTHVSKIKYLHYHGIVLLQLYEADIGSNNENIDQ